MPLQIRPVGREKYSEFGPGSPEEASEIMLFGDRFPRIILKASRPHYELEGRAGDSQLTYVPLQAMYRIQVACFIYLALGHCLR